MTRKERRERIIKEIRETYDAVAKEELSNELKRLLDALK
jgi:hypothetical protein